MTDTYATLATMNARGKSDGPEQSVSKSLRNLFLITVVIAVAVVAVSVYRIAHRRTPPNPGSLPNMFGVPLMAVAPPSDIGCYYHKPGHQEWQSVACVPQSVVSKLPRAQADPTLFAASKGTGTATVVPATSRASSLWEGYVGISFFNFSGEKDSFFGFDSFSIQANSNLFKGNNGDTDWVQFVYQNEPPGAYALPTLCVWSEDITLAGTDPANSTQGACVYPPAQPLQSNWGATLYGVTSGALRCRLRFGCRTVYTLTASFETLAGGWCVTAPDTFGLSVNWDQISGTILGAAMSSQAQFRSPTIIGSNTGAYGPGLTDVLSSNQGATTAETNNLHILYRSTPCNGNGWCFVSSLIGN